MNSNDEFGFRLREAGLTLKNVVCVAGAGSKVVAFILDVLSFLQELLVPSNTRAHKSVCFLKCLVDRLRISTGFISS